ncbi:MAG: hypothetical protein ACI9WS_000456 [Paraglaciecola psychrophila]|jgi:hypothetical protein
MAKKNQIKTTEIVFTIELCASFFLLNTESPEPFQNLLCIILTTTANADRTLKLSQTYCRDDALELTANYLGYSGLN